MDSPQATYQDLSIRFMTSIDKKKGFSQHCSNDDLLASFDDTIYCFLRCDLGLAVCKQLRLFSECSTDKHRIGAHFDDF